MGQPKKIYEFFVENRGAYLVFYERDHAGFLRHKTTVEYKDGLENCVKKAFERLDTMRAVPREFDFSIKEIRVDSSRPPIEGQYARKK